MPKEIDEETKEILISFIAEGYERLDDAEAQLAKIGGGDDTSVLNCVFRLFHSVKGSAGFLGFEEIKKLTHEAETLLDVFLKEKHDVDQESLDVVFATIDVLRTLIGIVEKEYGDETGAEKAREQTAALTAHIAKLRGDQSPAKRTAPTAPASPASSTSPTSPASSTAPAKPAPAVATPVTEASPPPVANTITLSELVTADMVDRFTGECADACDLIEKTVLAMDPAKPNEEEINAVFRHVHTMKGNSGFFGYAFLESVCMGLEGTLDLARKSKRPVGEALISGVIETVDRIRSALSSLDITNGKAPDTPESIDAQYKPIGEILIDMGVVKDEILKEALSEQERPIGEILVQKGIVDRENVEKALKIQKETTMGAVVVDRIRRRHRPQGNQGRHLEAR